jgi:hypothetical protein
MLSMLNVQSLCSPQSRNISNQGTCFFFPTRSSLVVFTSQWVEALKMNVLGCGLTGMSTLPSWFSVTPQRGVGLATEGE